MQIQLTHFEDIADRLSEILGSDIELQQLTQFKDLVGDMDNPITILKEPNYFKGYSRNYRGDSGFGVTFKMYSKASGPISAQRIDYRSVKTHEDVVRDTLVAMIKLAEDTSSGTKLGTEPNSVRINYPATK